MRKSLYFIRVVTNNSSFDDVKAGDFMIEYAPLLKFFSTDDVQYATTYESRKRAKSAIRFYGTVNVMYEIITYRLERSLNPKIITRL